VGPAHNVVDDCGVGADDDEIKRERLADFDDVFFKARAHKDVVEGRQADGDEQDNAGKGIGSVNEIALKGYYGVGYVVEAAV